jgi:hypothetical protein
MPDDLAEPVVTAASFFCCWRAMGEAFTRHSLHPLNFEGEHDAQLGRNGAAGLIEHVTPPVMPRFKRGIQYSRDSSA